MTPGHPPPNLTTRIWSCDQVIRWPKPRASVKRFLNCFPNTAPKFTSTIDKAAKEAERFILQNPFVLDYNSADVLLDKAQKAAMSEPDDYCRAAFFLFVAAFEGLLNLVYELYAKSELRDEEFTTALPESK